MKKFAYFLLLIVLSCNTESKESLILGEWIITSWVASDKNDDSINSEGVGFNVFFDKDSVYVTETEKYGGGKYKFKWDIQSDSLNVEVLGTFAMKFMSGKNCILTTDNFFSDSQGSNIQTLTLSKK